MAAIRNFLGSSIENRSRLFFLHAKNGQSNLDELLGKSFLLNIMISSIMYSYTPGEGELLPCNRNASRCMNELNSRRCSARAFHCFRGVVLLTSRASIVLCTRRQDAEQFECCLAHEITIECYSILPNRP